MSRPRWTGRMRVTEEATARVKVGFSRHGSGVRKGRKPRDRVHQSRGLGGPFGTPSTGLSLGGVAPPQTPPPFPPARWMYRKPGRHTRASQAGQDSKVVVVTEVVQSVA